MKVNNSRTRNDEFGDIRNEGIDDQNDEIKIEPYAPHQSIVPKDYEDRAMKALRSSFQKQVTDFLDQTSPDQYNAGFADNIINKAMQEALSELAIQRQQHIRTIEYSLASLWKGDGHYYKQLLADNEAEYAKRDTELQKLKAIYYRGTALETQDVEKGGKTYEL